MKTPEEIKKGLECCIVGECNSKQRTCPYRKEDECTMEIARDALAYIQQLEAQNAELLQKIQQLEAQSPKWISVEEALPEHGRYLVITQKGVCMTRKVHTATYNHLGWWIYADFGEVTHWMPLPEPPKEG